MKRLHGEIGRMIDAAEVNCKEDLRGNCTNTACDFHRAGYCHPCTVTDLRIILNREGFASRNGQISADIQRAGLTGDW